MWEVYIIEQEQDGVQSVVFFWLALLSSTEVERKKSKERKHKYWQVIEQVLSLQ